MHPLALITGHRKGGTTLFYNLFDGHPNLSCYPTDLAVLYAYFPHITSSSLPTEQLRERLKAVVCGPAEARIQAVLGEDVAKQFSTNFLARVGDDDLGQVNRIIEAMVAAWSDVARIESGTGVLVKETSSDIYAAEIMTWFPNLKMIHVVRDPRDNYAALKAGVSDYYSKLGENDLETLASLLFRGSLDLRLADLNAERFGADRYLVLRFEDVVRDTKTAMEQAARFLGVEFHNSMLSPTKLGSPTAGNNFDNEKFFEVSDKNVGRWEQRISPDEAAIIEFHFAELMDRFQYPCKFSAAQQADAYSEFYKWANYRYYYHDSFAATAKESST